MTSHLYHFFFTREGHTWGTMKKPDLQNQKGQKGGKAQKKRRDIESKFL